MNKVFFLLILFGCATVYPECNGNDACNALAREYARMEYIETEFKPRLAGCKAAGGYLVYQGMMTRQLRRALDTGDYAGLRRVELVGFSCAAGMSTW